VSADPDRKSSSRDRDTDDLVSGLYDELHRRAAAFIRREPKHRALQPTLLVHEAYLRLAARDVERWHGRTQFCAAAAGAMRRVLVDHARGDGRVKRGARWQRVTLSEEVAVAPERRDVDVLTLHELLCRLEALDPREAKIVEMRFFAGLSAEEIAKTLGVSSGTVRRDWLHAKAWLHRELARAERS
jgi:RNA polymerase sigma factor (TIGR02999 family)